MRIYNQTGLTMTELLITLAIVGVMMSVSMPSMNSFAEDNQVSSDTKAMFNSLQLARSESATRNSRVSLCKIDPAAPTACENSESWDSGWIVFEDTNLDSTRNAGEQIFLTAMGMQENTVVSTSDYATTISFLPSGGVTNNGTLTLCVAGNVARSITINATGRPRMVNSSCP